MVFQKFRWDDVHCFEKYPYLCMRDPVEPSPPAQ